MTKEAQGYLAHTKMPPPRNLLLVGDTLDEEQVEPRPLVWEGGLISYERQGLLGVPAQTLLLLATQTWLSHESPRNLLLVGDTLGEEQVINSSTLDPRPSTLIPRPSTLNPQPSTLNPRPSTLNPHLSTLDPQPSTLNPRTSTLNPKPSALNAEL